MGSSMWTQAEAIELCRRVEQVCPAFGCHVALTGGLLYKDGPRKDADLVFYRIRQVECVEVEGLFDALASIGLTLASKSAVPAWCIKATWCGKPVDCFFPEAEPRGDYPLEPAAWVTAEEPEHEPF